MKTYSLLNQAFKKFNFVDKFYDYHSHIKIVKRIHLNESNNDCVRLFITFRYDNMKMLKISKKKSLAMLHK